MKNKGIFRTKKEKGKEKNCSILDFPQQLACPVPAAAVHLTPLVEGGCGQCKHYQVLLLQTQAAYSYRVVAAAGPAEDLPGDGVGGPSILVVLPDMGGCKTLCSQCLQRKCVHRVLHKCVTQLHIL